MNNLKHLSFGLVSALALGVGLPAANAADIYKDRGSIKDSGPGEYVPSITWTGFYVGAHVGAAFSDDDVEIIDDNAFLAGAHLGYNWQGPSNIVIGIEGDVSYLDNVDYLASIRGRLGYAFGPRLAYVTGGAAFIGFEEENLSGDDAIEGWVAGAGLEHKLRENVSIGAEALYYGFEDENGGDDENFWVARARLTYHFNSRRDALK